MIAHLYGFSSGMNWREKGAVYGVVFAIIFCYAIFNDVVLGRPERRVTYETVALVLFFMVVLPIFETFGVRLMRKMGATGISKNLEYVVIPAPLKPAKRDMGHWRRPGWDIVLSSLLLAVAVVGFGIYRVGVERENVAGYVVPFSWPVVGMVQPAGGGGIDIFAPPETPVRAAANGEVVQVVGDTMVSNGFGQGAVIRHDVEGTGMYVVYGHLQELKVKPGDKINKGQIIGTVERKSVSGESPNLRFGIVQIGGQYTFTSLEMVSTKAINPLPYLPKPGQNN